MKRYIVFSLADNVLYLFLLNIKITSGGHYLNNILFKMRAYLFHLVTIFSDD